MKTKFILSFAALVMALSSNSQIKIFPGGSVSIGATTSPTASSVNHQIIGAKTVFPSSTSAITSAPLIQGSNGYSSASAPCFTWHGDNNTGIFHPASDVLGFASGGFEAFRINASKQILSKQQASDASTPEYSWDTDPNTGIIRPGNDQIALVTAGTEKMKINASGQICKSNSNASASTPDFSWTSDANTGVFSPGSDILGFSTGGTERVRITTYGNLLMGTTSVENARINTITSGYGGIYCKATYGADWGLPVIDSETDRANSVTYRGGITGTGTTFYVTGAGWIYNAGGIYNGSDKDIKDDIKNIDSALTKVLQLNGVTYKLKREKQNPNLYPTAQEYIGVIAQDVEKVAPQAVKTVLDGTKAVNYDMLIGLLIEALKEQNAKVTQLQSEVNNCCSKKGETQQSRFINTNEETPTELYAGNSYIKQNAPNPFSKETNIEYYIIEKNASSSILVFDMSGKLLKTFKLNGSGKGNLTINGNEFSPGMYYYSLIINAIEVGTKKMILTE